MAGDWIPYCRDLPDKPEVLAIARATGRTIEDVVGTLLRFWAWADAQSATGEVCPVSVPDLSHVCPRADDAFWNALARVGWLRSIDDAITIPNFEHWMGSSAKHRLYEARRKRKYRQTQTPNVPHGVGHSRDKVGTKLGPQERREQKRRDNPPVVPHGFIAFWSAYPRKDGKQAALKAWTKLAPPDALQEQILAALARQRQSDQWTRDGGQYIPHASTWLNGRRWEDQGPQADGHPLLGGILDFVKRGEDDAK